jgi:alpha-beta hydrolase superfamily lysophospholipase
MVVRGEFDGIATEEDLVNFFQKLPSGDRQLVVLPGTAHSLAVNMNRHLFWHAMRGFLSTPARADTIGKS